MTDLRAVEIVEDLRAALDDELTAEVGTVDGFRQPVYDDLRINCRANG